MDLFEAFVRERWIKPKNQRSLEYMKNAPKVDLPPLKTKRESSGRFPLSLFEEINGLVQFTYKLDPWNGLLDYYNHPGYSWWRKINNQTDHPYDCDDFACLAKGFINAAGGTNADSWLWTICPGPLDQFTQAKWNHVICGFRYVAPDGRVWTGVIDTNTAYHKTIFWFPFPKEESKPHVLKRFKSIYPANYAHCIESEYVF